MSDDSKIISLSDRARQRKDARSTPRHGRRKAPPGAGPPASATGAAGAAPPQPAPNAPLPAKLVWLYCPVCETLEYTELALPAGRVHQPCGTKVEEIEVAVDARAEYSLAELNLRQLERLAELVEGQRVRFRELQHRLELAAGQPLSSYPLTEDTVRVMPVAEVDPLGLLISAFLRQPMQRFRPDESPAAASPEAPPADASAPAAPPPDAPPDAPSGSSSGTPSATPRSHPPMPPPPATSGKPAPGSGDEPAS
jgi:hypothetical protein